MLGQFMATVQLDGQSAVLPVQVAASDFPALFGLPWMQYIRPNWERLIPSFSAVPSQVMHIDNAAVKVYVETLSSRFASVFGKTPGPIKHYKINLRLKSEGAFHSLLAWSPMVDHG